MKCCVIGLGVFGRHLSLRLSQLGADVLAIDRSDENVSAIKDEVGAAVVMRFDDNAPLDRFPIAEMDVVVIAIGDELEDSMAMTLKVHELGAKQIVCRVLSPMHERLLRLMKVGRLVIPEEVAARGLAHSLLLRGVVNGFDLGSGHALIEVGVPPSMVGKTLADTADAFREADVRVVTVKRLDRGLLSGLGRARTAAEERTTLGVVPLDQRFEADDLLVLFGAEADLREFLEDQGG
jgi:trk system potassium uptake protein TrkA